MRRQARLFGDKTFLSFGDGSSLTFEAFERRVAAFRAHLTRLGVGAGERVALMMKNSLDYPVAWLGIVTAGAVAVPTNSRLKEIDARYIFDHSGAVALLVDDSTRAVAASAMTPLVREVFTPQDVDGARLDHEEAGPDLHPGTLANIQYTSGTTGFPKGCLLSHAYWQWMGFVAARVMRIGERDTLLTSQPHSYIDPQWQVISALQSGAHLVVLDGFHPRTFMADVARFGATLFYCLGVMPTLLLKQPPSPADRDNSLERVYCSAIPMEQHADIEKRWGVPWSEVFGMTETGINTAVPPEDRDRLVGTACIGRALPHNDASVIDPNDRPLPRGEVGELVLRGEGFMDGYHEDPDATAAFFRNGWAHTGDLAEQDENGLIYYRGRLKEMIRRAGENISPVEIETALGTHPDVVECAVAPVADPDVGEEIKVYVVARPGAAGDAESLEAYLQERLARFKVPRYWEFRVSLPHTPSERVAKHELERDRESFLVDTVDLRRPI